MSEEAVEMSELDEVLGAHLQMAEESNEDVDMEFEEIEEELGDEGEPAVVTEELEEEDDLSGEGELVDESIVADGTGEQAPAEAPASDLPAEAPAIKYDHEHNIVNDKGEIVARAGAERRLFQKLQTAERTIEDTNRAHEGFKQFAQAPQKMGLTPNEAVQGMQFIADLKTKPVEAARSILQEAMKQGYNLHDIIGTQEGVENSSVDMGAIQRMMDQKLAPITQQYEQQQQQVQSQRESEQLVQQFVQGHEFSDVHLDTIKHLMQNNPNLTSERAYYEVKTYAIQQGLDFSQPLAPQMEAMQQQAVPPQQVTPPNPKPLPNGNANSVVVNQDDGYSGGDDDWDSIVRSSMRDAGYN